MGRKSNGRMTISEAAKRVGVSPKTLLRWEKAGKVQKPKRDWRGWRVYEEEDVNELQAFHDRLSRW
ncbi:MAG: MerR family transcriptional regulator [Candidatus Brocadiia bacterium]